MAKAEARYVIKHVGDHYQGYVDGKFVCSGDRETEVAKDIEEHLYERSKVNENSKTSLHRLYLLQDLW